MTPHLVHHLTFLRQLLTTTVNGMYASAILNLDLSSALDGNTKHTVLYRWAAGNVYYPGKCGITIKHGTTRIDQNTFGDMARNEHEFDDREFTFTPSSASTTIEVNAWCITSGSFDQGAPSFYLKEISVTESCPGTTIPAGDTVSGTSSTSGNNLIDNPSAEQTVTDDNTRWYGSDDIRILGQSGAPYSPKAHEGSKYM